MKTKVQTQITVVPPPLSHLHFDNGGGQGGGLFLEQAQNQKQDDIDHPVFDSLFSDCHSFICGEGTKASTRAHSSRMLIGLDMYTSQPAARAFSASPLSALAVIAITGTYVRAFFFSLLRILRATS